MASKANLKNKTVGVIGSGSFGTALSNLLAQNNRVLLYTRRQEVVDDILQKKKNVGQDMHPSVTPTMDAEELASNCTLIFPTVPSANFRQMMKTFAPFMHPGHLLIHGTKGLDLQPPTGKTMEDDFEMTRDCIRTMSEVIREESPVVRVGSLAGPNLAGELALGQPAATVIASRFDEVIREGRAALRSPRFQVYGNHDIIGVELSGVLKNCIAIGSGSLSGLGLGENARALLMTKGLAEMIRLGTALGSETTAFLGLAGIGDLIATCTSKLSRNYNVGFRLAQGEKLQDILNSVSEVAEGVNTIRIAHRLSDYYAVQTPIIDTLYKILFENMAPLQGLEYLMNYPLSLDVDFL